VAASSKLGRTIFPMVAIFAFLAAGPMAALAERPSAPKLLPEKTLAYIRIADTRALVERFNETAFGRLFHDEQVQPLVAQLYGSASQLFMQVQQRIGLSLDELLAIPQGEVSVALVGRDDGRPAVVALVEVGEQATAARKLIEFAEDRMIARGTTRRSERIGDTTIVNLEGRVSYCEREGVYLFCSDPSLLKAMLKVWDGDSEVKTLVDNFKFNSIMRQSVGTKNERPQVTWFVDPIELFRNVARDDLGAQMALAMLPALGLDGIKALGGSMIFATEEFDSISYMHLMLDNPRVGILEMIAIESGDLTPEDWVPADAASYMSVYWDSKQTLAAFRKLYNTIRNRENALHDDIHSRISSQLGIDFEKDVLDQIDGRATHVSWFEKPARVNSGTNLVGIKLEDSSAVRKTVDKLAGKFGDRFTKKNYSGITYYQITPRREPQQLDEELVRRPTPCVCILGDYFLFSDSAKCLEAAIANKNDPDKSLDKELDFKLIASKAKQYLGSDKPGMMVFSRPEETMRSFYELATSPSTRRRLTDAAQRNPVFGELDKALHDHPLPPFAVIAKYLAPAGGTVVSDQTGIHYMAFSLKRE